MRETHHLRSAIVLVQAYNGELPFAAWLKNHFREQKKFGSSDRKAIADLCFCYFRLGRALAHFGIEDRMLAAQVLCHTQSRFVQALQPEWAALQSLPLLDKLQQLGETNPLALFPLSSALSPQIEAEGFALSHLQQPDLFLRIRPGQQANVLSKLQSAGCSYVAERDCIRLPNSTKLDDLLTLDREAVVQDKSSQRVLDALLPHIQKAAITAWDCCAASGGKSILLHDRLPQTRLTVSDIRETILHNLRSRFARAGVQFFTSFVADLSQPSFRCRSVYDVVVCDAPCSGSGTWSRTPEQLRFFERGRLAHYTTLQKSIAQNAARCLRKGGYFVYVTCSVFEAENEAVTAYIAAETGLQLVSQQYIRGYAEKADTLFTALFRS